MNANEEELEAKYKACGVGELEAHGAYVHVLGEDGGYEWADACGDNERAELIAMAVNALIPLIGQVRALVAEDEAIQLREENERLLKREDELEQTIAELNAFDVPREMVNLRIENKRLISRVEELEKSLKITRDGLAPIARIYGDTQANDRPEYVSALQLASEAALVLLAVTIPDESEDKS